MKPMRKCRYAGPSAKQGVGARVARATAQSEKHQPRFRDTIAPPVRDERGRSAGVAHGAPIRLSVIPPGRRQRFAGAVRMCGLGFWRRLHGWLPQAP